MERKTIEKHYDEFIRESKYLSFDGKIQLKTIAVDFAEYLLSKIKGVVIPE